MCGGFRIRAYLAKCPLGAFAIDEAGKVIKFRPYEGTVVEAAESFSNNTDEVILAKYLVGEGFEVVSESKLPVDGVVMASPNPGGEELRRRMAEIAVEIGLAGSHTEVEERVRLVSLALAKKALEVTGEPDEARLIGQVRLMVEVAGSVETITKLLKEATIALEPGLKGLDTDEPAAVLQAVSSSGGRIERELSKTVRALLDARGELERSVEAIANRIAPNLAEVAGPVLAARLITEAGGLRKLALMSATKVQVLGARTAVFRHIREGGKPPKHGVIFLHPLVCGAKWWQRGKIAKALASTITIAARGDAFGERIAGHALRARLDKAVAVIREERVTPPEPKRPKRPGARRKKNKKS